MNRIEDSEYFFISYDNVIRHPSAYLLHKIVNNSDYKEFDNFIKTEELVDKTINEIAALSNIWATKNPLEYYAKQKFDYNMTYAELFLTDDNVYNNSPLLKFGETLPLILNQQFTKKVFIYSREYDPRIDADIRKQFNANRKISYVNGEFIDVVKSVENITTFIIDDISMVQELLDNDIISYKTILLANYGYNYKLSDIIIDENYGRELTLKIDNIDKLSTEKVFKLKMFLPI